MQLTREFVHKVHSSIAALEMLPMENYKGVGEEVEECSLCMMTIEESQVVRKLPCGHLFHLECVGKGHALVSVALADTNIVLQTLSSSAFTPWIYLNTFALPQLSFMLPCVAYVSKDRL